MKTIKALVSFVYIGANGSITSYAGGQVYEVTNEMATQMISIGYAEEYSEGGGGSSDFSTAEVTITNNSGGEVLFYLPVYMNIPGYGAIIQGFMMTNSEEPTFGGEVVIPTNGKLYVGSTLAQFTTSNTTVTGNATVEHGQLVITGDCTITIS